MKSFLMALTALCLCLSGQAEENAVNEFCPNPDPEAPFGAAQTAAIFSIAVTANRVNRVVPLLNEHRNRVIQKSGFRVTEPTQYLIELSREPDFFAKAEAYLQDLERPIAWKGQKDKLARWMKGAISAQEGNEKTKKKLKQLIQPNRLVSIRQYFQLAAEQPKKLQPYWVAPVMGVCGADGLNPSAIAFWHGKTKKIAFCPGLLLRAQATMVDGKLQWTKKLDIRPLLFAAFHELGHVLGADPTSPYLPLYREAIECLDRRHGKIGARYEVEALADLWAIEGLWHVLSRQSRWTDKQKSELIQLGLVPFRNSFYSPHHLPFGARLNIIQAQLCPRLKKNKPDGTQCNFRLESLPKQ